MLHNIPKWKEVITVLTKYDSDATLVSDKPDIYVILSEIWMFVCPAINLILLYTGGYKNMPVWASILCALITAGIPSAVTLILSRKSKLTRNTESLENLSTSIESYKKEQKEDLFKLESMVNERYNWISAKMGKGINDKTLTAQHGDLQALIQKEIDLSEKRYTDEEERVRKFTKKQKDMARTVNEFKLFLDSWQQLADCENSLLERIEQLERENGDLRAFNQELRRSQKQRDSEQRER